MVGSWALVFLFCCSVFNYIFLSCAFFTRQESAKNKNGESVSSLNGFSGIKEVNKLSPEVQLTQQQVSHLVTGDWPCIVVRVAYCGRRHLSEMTSDVPVKQPTTHCGSHSVLY